jgi:hypothetical protein
MGAENSSISPEVQQHELFQNLLDPLGPNFGILSAEPHALEATL